MAFWRLSLLLRCSQVLALAAFRYGCPFVTLRATCYNRKLEKVYYRVERKRELWSHSGHWLKTVTLHLRASVSPE
jgi:hypothetical protein